MSKTHSRNSIAHFSRKNRRMAARNRRSGMASGVPLYSEVIAKALRAAAKAEAEARMAARCAAEMDTSSTYRPIM